MKESLTIADLLKPQVTTHLRRSSIQLTSNDYSSQCSRRDLFGSFDGVLSPRQSITVKKSFCSPEQPHETGAASPYSEKGNSRSASLKFDSNNSDEHELRKKQPRTPKEIFVDTSTPRETTSKDASSPTPKEQSLKHGVQKDYKGTFIPLKRATTSRDIHKDQNIQQIVRQDTNDSPVHFPSYQESSSTLQTWKNENLQFQEVKHLRKNSVKRLRAFQKNQNSSCESFGEAMSGETFGEPRKSQTQSSQTFNPSNVETIDNFAHFMQIFGFKDQNKYFKVGEKIFCMSQKLVNQISDFEKILQKESPESESDQITSENKIESIMNTFAPQGTALETISENSSKTSEKVSQSQSQSTNQNQKRGHKLSQFYQKSSTLSSPGLGVDNLNISKKSPQFSSQSSFSNEKQDTFSTRSKRFSKTKRNTVSNELFSGDQLQFVAELEKYEEKKTLPRFSGTTISQVQTNFGDDIKSLFFQKKSDLSDSLTSSQSSLTLSPAQQQQSTKNIDTNLLKTKANDESKQRKPKSQIEINLALPVNNKKDEYQGSEFDTPSFQKQPVFPEPAQSDLSLPKLGLPKLPKGKRNAFSKGQKKIENKPSEYLKQFEDVKKQIEGPKEEEMAADLVAVPLPGFKKKKKNPFVKITQQLEQTKQQENTVKEEEPQKEPLKFEAKEEVLPLPVPGFGKKKKNPFAKLKKPPVLIIKEESKEKHENNSGVIQLQPASDQISAEKSEEIIPKIVKLPKGRKKNPFRKISEKINTPPPNEEKPKCDTEKKVLPAKISLKKKPLSNNDENANIKIKKCVSFEVEENFSHGSSLKDKDSSANCKTPNNQFDKEAKQMQTQVEKFLYKTQKTADQQLAETRIRKTLQKKASTKDLVQELVQDTNQIKQIEKQLLTMQKTKSDMKAKREMFKTMSYREQKAAQAQQNVSVSDSTSSISGSFQSFSSSSPSPTDKTQRNFQRSPTKINKQTFGSKNTLQVTKTQLLDKISEMNEKYEGFSDSDISDFSVESSSDSNKKKDTTDIKGKPQNLSDDSSINPFESALESPSKLSRTDTILTENDSLEQPIQTEQSENQNLVEYVGNLAKGFGLDPDLFLDEEIMSSSPDPLLKSKRKQVSHRVKREQKKDRDVREVIKVLKTQQSQQQIRHIPSLGRNSQPLQHFNSNQIPINHQFSLTSPEKTQKNENIGGIPLIPEGSESIQQSSDLQTLQSVKYDITKHTLQLAILRKFVKQIQDKKEGDEFKFINEALSMIQNNQAKIDEIMKMIKNQESQLHFAFFFASPLVLSSQSGQESSYKLIPPLNYKAEFQKIKESIVNAQVQIRITKRQCTTTSLNEILAEKPMVIHFSGHGLLNTKAEIGFELSEIYKGQGDLLLLETETGDSQLVSRDALKKMILKNECELQLVVVATCHSEFVGKIFQQAGAKHVVCIQQSQEVADEAIITFTETFYNMLFRQNKRVCDAYEMAVDQVNLVHGELQAKIFKLLKIEDQFRFSKTIGGNDKKRDGNQPHKCCQLNFQKGKMTEQLLYDSQLKNTAVAVPSLLGRQKDMFKLLQKIMVSMTSRLFQLTGLPGVGKSALVRNTLHFIEERSLLQGGSIYINSQDFEQTEQFARYFNQEVMNNNSVLFGKSLENEHDANKTLNLLLSKISMIEGSILLVIDNADELIQNDKISFINLLTQMLRRLPQLRIMITSRMHIDSEFTQDLMVLPSLQRNQACNLFKKLTRELTKQDIDGLMRTKPNFDLYPQEQAKYPYKKLHEHHFFTLLGGNPQSISLVAPLLTDPSQCLSLDGLYELLQSQKIYDILDKRDTPNQEIMSLKICAQISIQHFQENDEESMELFFLLGLLPGGISNVELDELWIEVQKAMQGVRSKGQESDYYGDQSFEEQMELNQEKLTSLTKKSTTDQKYSWIRSYNQLLQGNLIEVKDSDKKGKQGDLNLSRNDQFIIQMPPFVQNFSEGLIPKETCEIFNSVLTAWFLKKMVSFYKFANLSATEQQNYEYNQENDKAHFLGRFQQNLNAFVEFMAIKYAKRANFADQIEQNLDKSFQSDEEFIDDDRAFDSSSDSDDSCDSPDPPNNFYNTFPIDKKQLPALPGQLSKTKTMSLWKKQETIRIKQTFEDESEAMFKAQLEYVQNNERERKSSLYKKRNNVTSQTSGLEQQARCGIGALGGMQIEEQKDSDSDFSFIDGEASPKMPKTKSKSTNFVGFFRQNTEHGNESYNNFKKIQRFSLAKKGKMVSTKKDDFPARRATAQYFEQMNSEEMTMSYFVATLVIYEQFSPVLKLTDKYFRRMKETSLLFKGNIRRFEALARLQLLEQESRKSHQNVSSSKSLTSLDIEFDDLFMRAERNYKKKPICFWGLGLTYLQEAQTNYYLLKKLKSQRNEEKKQKLSGSNTVQMAKINRNTLSLHNQVKETQFKINKVKDRLNLAISNLERIQHFRALSCAYNLKAKILEIQLLESQDNFELLRSSTASSENGPPSSWIDKDSEKEIVGLIKDSQTKRREYMRQTERALKNLIQKKREIFINRKQGEEFSIFIGIVHSRRVGFLIERQRTSIQNTSFISEQSGNKSQIMNFSDAECASPTHSLSQFGSQENRKASKKKLQLNVIRLGSQIDEANSNSESESEETKEDRFSHLQEQAQDQLDVARHRKAVKRPSLNTRE